MIDGLLRLSHVLWPATPASKPGAKSRQAGNHAGQRPVVANSRRQTVPTISRFYGVSIEMFWREHGPPHFHASYGSDEAVVEIRTSRVIRGFLPRRALSMVLEWAELHREQLLENWTLCNQLKHPRPIAGLD